MRESTPPGGACSDSSPDWFGLAAAVVTALLNTALLSSNVTAWFIGGACLFWTGFVIARFRSDPRVLHRWGFRLDNLAQAAVPAGALFVVVAAGLAIFGAASGTLRAPLHLPLLLLVYTLWGVIQQLLLMGIVVGNMSRVGVFRQRPWLVVLIAAFLFGCVHAYDPLLAASTSVLGLALVPLYLKYGNLWPLAVLHGWLGALFYLWVLNRDLWAENLPYFS